MNGEGEAGSLQSKARGEGFPLRVVVLSAHRAMAGAIARYLARRGFIVTFTTSESRAVEQRAAFDLLLIDLPEEAEGPALDWRAVVAATGLPAAVLWPAALAGDVRVATGRAPVAFFQKPVAWDLVVRELSSLGRASRAPVPGAPPGGRDAVAPPPLLRPLSLREGETLVHLVSGLGNKQIAARMGVSEPTVKKHVQHIVAKLGAVDRTHAAVLAVRQGLV